jgi:hypothetical protein
LIHKRRRTLFWGLTILLATSLGSDARQPAETSPSEPHKLKYEEPKVLTGEIFAAGSDPQKLLFKFKRVATRNGQTLDVVREYSYPDGKLAAREHVVYKGNALVLFELEETQSGGKGSARVFRESGKGDLGKIEFDYTKGPDPNARTKPRSEPLAPDVLVADMIGPFLRDNWERLARGEKVKCRYIVVPRRETVGFTFVKESDSTWHGRDVMILRMEPTSRLLSALVNPLFFTIEKQPPHRVLQYVGRTTPKIAAGSKWKDLDALTVFDWQ